jgi:sulfate adenylyltransferase subunit 1 (EFTu-like GTPase family)
MHKKIKALSFITLSLTLITLVLSGCGSRTSSIKVGWMGSSTAGKTSYRYARFSGIERKTIHASAGETLTLDYDVDVEKGALALRLRNSDSELLWEQTFDANAEDSVEIPLERGGRYLLQIEGRETRGSFDLAWEK